MNLITRLFLFAVVLLGAIVLALDAQHVAELALRANDSPADKSVWMRWMTMYNLSAKAPTLMIIVWTFLATRTNPWRIFCGLPAIVGGMICVMAITFLGFQSISPPTFVILVWSGSALCVIGAIALVVTGSIPSGSARRDFGRGEMRTPDVS